MKTPHQIRLLLGGLLAVTALMGAEPPLKISVAEYRDKVYAAWLGQCVGNLYGLPHESSNIEKPGAADFPYGYVDQKGIREADGCFSDDDTDFEYMYLTAMERFGPEPRYKDLASVWKHHVRDRVWIANRSALGLMHYGYTPPFTGSRTNNEHWFQIDPQLINEIWAVTAPGMIHYAAAKSLWGAHICADGWGVEPTVHYGAMYAAAFFERDVNKLIDIGTRSLPQGSRFAGTVENMKALYRRYPHDWQRARAELAEKYYTQEPTATRSDTNANLNGGAGILALLYGQGDFQKTLDLSCAIGFDADNQAATMAGLIAVIHGTRGIPRDLLFPLRDRHWREPFNDRYKNVSRYGLPDASLKDMGRRTALLGEKIVLGHGGKKVTENGVDHYLINPDAAFAPPFELPVGPAPVIETGKRVHHAFTTVGGQAPLTWRMTSGTLPGGLTFEGGVLAGSTTAVGVFPITIEVKSGRDTESLSFPVVVRSANLASTASSILTPGSESRREPSRGTQPHPLFSADPEVLRDGRSTGPSSAFRSVLPPGNSGRQHYGYRWEEPHQIGLVSFCPGPEHDDAEWYRTFAVEYEDASGTWRAVEGLRTSPALPVREGPYSATGVEYLVAFRAVRTRAIRIGGEVSVSASRQRSTSLSELRVYAPLPDAVRNTAAGW